VTIVPLPAKLYFFDLSHPAQAARLMLEQKGLEHETVRLLPGLHPVQLRLARFRGPTVPALKIDGRRIQGSRRISRALDDIRPEPALFPAAMRERVEQAEAWGEQVLQPVPRRIFRWAVSRRPDLRRWLAKQAGLPAPGVMARVNAPLARRFARISQATDASVEADAKNVPELLDHADQLISDGTIGGPELNAADFQIGTSVRALMLFAELRPSIEGRPCAGLATKLLPRFAGPLEIGLPDAWLSRT
jgi:glutathione S-transferase